MLHHREEPHVLCEDRKLIGIKRILVEYVLMVTDCALAWRLDDDSNHAGIADNRHSISREKGNVATTDGVGCRHQGNGCPRGGQKMPSNDVQS